MRQIDFNDEKTLEKYSSSITLSDMEIFIFPELFYSLLLANIMSPIIWKWRDDPWFNNIEKKNFNYKVNRIKQFIMEKYVFNLDLETWGLTTKDTELKRFDKFIDTKTLSQSNALFGYEGDKYYFSIDIRRHFGLDKYTTDVIPYWKTETVEAMTAFSNKPSYACGAGECVSLSALYAAAMFIIGKIPLERIFLIATPLHSQNFIAEKDGIITNNRRIVTKNMWFNGTSLSAKARRALENEKVTIVSHITGYIHILYDNATINPQAYSEFKESILKYLKGDITPTLFSNFLRNESECRKCFQYRHYRHGKAYYIALEKIFHYEHSSRNSFTGNQRNSLLKEIDAEEFNVSPLEDRVLLNDLEQFLNENQNISVDGIRLHFTKNIAKNECSGINKMFNRLKKFSEVIPTFPSMDKNFEYVDPLQITPEQSRSEIKDYIFEKARTNEVAALAVYAYRPMDKINWKPFVKAVLERNPVSIQGVVENSIEEVYQYLQEMGEISIYHSTRLAQPDEVFNYLTGDGLEKAFFLANVIRNRDKKESISLNCSKQLIELKYRDKSFVFLSEKGLTKEITF